MPGTPTIDGNLAQRITLVRKPGAMSRFFVRGTNFSGRNGEKPTVTLEGDKVGWPEPLPAEGVRVIGLGDKEYLVIQARCLSFDTANSTGGSFHGVAQLRIDNGDDNPKYDIDTIYIDDVFDGGYGGALPTPTVPVSS